jgi:isochorismate synthase
MISFSTNSTPRYNSTSAVKAEKVLEAGFGVDERILQLLIAEGLRRAQERQRPVPISLVQCIGECDPLAFFSQGAALFHDRVLWSRPSIGFTVAGVGAAWTFSAERSHSFAQASKAWHDYCDQAVVAGETGVAGTGLFVLGGFSFDPLQPTTMLWDGYPDNLLILPRYTLTQVGNATWLTINLVIEPDCTFMDETEVILELQALLAAESGSMFPTPRNQLLCVEDMLPAAQWKNTVGSAIQDIKQGELEKVVLARSCYIEGQDVFSPAQALEQLSTAYPDCFLFAVARGNRCFLGASPERLVRLQSNTVWVTCLAGSIARGKTEDEDRKLGEQLLSASKERFEHDAVVQMLSEALAELCVDPISVPAPTLMKMPNIQHLFTPITGRLADDRTILELVERLHPTPALGGTPRRDALEFIRNHEGLDRGWYAAPIGWMDANGDGEFAVAIRSALLTGSEAILFAGCGIVADSDQEQEYIETCLKMRPMLAALGDH